MEGRVALITGAARGIGRAIAEALGRSGARVVLTDLRRPLRGLPYPSSSAAELAETTRKLRKQGLPARSFCCDVRSARAVERLFEQVEAHEGGVDILVNNAGISVLHPIAEISAAEWALHLDVIATGAFLCCRRAMPYMNANRWGRIVNVASVAGIRGLGTGVAYCAAKHALVGLTRALALEAAQQGVTVNAVCPGTVQTELLRHTGKLLGLAPQHAAKRLSERHMHGEPLKVEDVARAVVWLASADSAAVQGTTLSVDAGWHAW